VSHATCTSTRQWICTLRFIILGRSGWNLVSSSCELRKNVCSWSSNLTLRRNWVAVCNLHIFVQSDCVSLVCWVFLFFMKNGLKKGCTFLPGVSKIMFTVQLETACFYNKTDVSKAHSLQFCTPQEYTRFKIRGMKMCRRTGPVSWTQLQK
jgi:hypothetical protein